MASTTIHLKVGQDMNDAFNQKARDLNRKPSDLLRDLITAFTEDRVTIQLTEEQLRLFGFKEEE